MASKNFLANLIDEITMNRQTKEIVNRITQMFKQYAASKEKKEAELLSSSVTSGKLYEAYILGIVAKNLVEQEKCKIVLVNDNFIRLKSSPGPINRNFPRLDIFKYGRKIAEIWTDIEFLTYSYCNSSTSDRALPCQYHEIDIIMVDPNLSGMPRVDNIWLAVECKNTSYSKNLLREILGIRRELSLLAQSTKTKLDNWPQSQVNADPPSCLLLFSTDSSVLDYSAPGKLFSIDFYHEELPDN